MSYHFSTKFAGTFDQAIAAATAALQQRGFGILTEIDVAATLKKKTTWIIAHTGSLAPVTLPWPTGRSKAHRASV